MYNLLFGHRETRDLMIEKIPDEFKCPITLDIMDDPVIDPEGNSYEREYIIKFLKGQEETGIEPSSPLTRTPLKISDLKENKELKDKIIKFKAVQDMPNIPNIPDTNLNYQKLKEGGSDGSANKISNMLSSFGGFWGAEPEPEVQDMVSGGASGVEHPRNYTNGWVIFVGAAAFPSQNTTELTMGGPNHSRATEICMEHELHGYMWARGNHYFTPTLPRRVTSDEYLMDITDQHPEGEPGNRHDAEKNRDEVHLAPGASLNLLAMKIIELKSLDHTRSIKLEIYIEDQGDYYELIHMNPELKGLIKMRKSVRGRYSNDPVLADVPYDPSLCSKRIWNGGLGAQCQSAKMGGDSSSEFCTRCTREFDNKGALPFGYYDQEKPEEDLVTGMRLPWKTLEDFKDTEKKPMMKGRSKYKNKKKRKTKRKTRKPRRTRRTQRTRRTRRTQRTRRTRRTKKTRRKQMGRYLLNNI